MTTTYPGVGDYYKAVQTPARAFTVPNLQTAEFVWDSLGPTLARGSSAVVFQAKVGGEPQALRCFIRSDASSRERYSRLDDYLDLHDLRPFVSGATWTDAAIRVNGATWPVLQMGWIDGRTLNEYVNYLVADSNTTALAMLAEKWLELVKLLQGVEFAHGDLQHGNVMVDQQGRLRLVDYDGVWIPQLARMSPPTEFGHPNYQHPGLLPWGQWFDTFSALVIYLSLVALAKNPRLWPPLYNSKNLLFQKTDFFHPFDTQTWRRLAELGDSQVDELSGRLRECCDPAWRPAKSLETTLEAPPAMPPPAPDGSRWWEKQSSGAAAAPSLKSSQPPQSSQPPSRQAQWPWATVPPGPAASLPTPPPLSLDVGTGPKPESHRTRRPDQSWWAASGSHAQAPSLQPSPQPSPPAPPTPGVWQGPAPVALAVGLGILLMIVGLVTRIATCTLIGLVSVAAGVYLLIARGWRQSRGGRSAKPPGQT